MFLYPTSCEFGSLAFFAICHLFRIFLNFFFGGKYFFPDWTTSQIFHVSQLYMLGRTFSAKYQDLNRLAHKPTHIYGELGVLVQKIKHICMLTCWNLRGHRSCLVCHMYDALFESRANIRSGHAYLFGLDFAPHWSETLALFPYFVERENIYSRDFVFMINLVFNFDLVWQLCIIHIQKVNCEGYVRFIRFQSGSWSLMLLWDYCEWSVYNVYLDDDFNCRYAFIFGWKMDLKNHIW